VLTVLAVTVFVAALLVIGLDGLIPFGLLLAFSTDSDEQETRRSVILTTSSQSHVMINGGPRT
jgi:hypothetical protein